MRCLFASDLAKADKGMHLVLIAANRFGHRRDLCDVGVGRDIQQFVMAEQPPQQAIQDGKPFGVAVQDRRSRQFDEFGRDIETALRRFKLQAVGGRFEQLGFAACTDHVTSDGFTWLSASVRAAFRQGSKSVSLSRMMRCMGLPYGESCPLLVIPGCATWRRPGIDNHHDREYGFRARAKWRAPK